MSLAAIFCFASSGEANLLPSICFLLLLLSAPEGKEADPAVEVAGAAVSKGREVGWGVGGGGC